MILPPWCRTSPKVAEALPPLDLHGLSTGDLGARAGGGAPGLGGRAVSGHHQPKVATVLAALPKSSNDPATSRPHGSDLIVGSSRGAVPLLPAARFPGPHLRTRRARRHATGSPQAPPLARRVPMCAGFAVPAVHASRCSPGTSCPSSHTPAGSLPPFAMCPPLVGSDYYEGSATPEHHQLTASLPTRVGGVGRFPRSPLADRRGRCPAGSRQPRHRYAAALPDGLLLGPVLRGRSRPPAPVGGRALQARPTSARFGAGRQLTGRQHWFLAYTCSSCLPDPGRLAVPTRPVVVGAAPTLPGASRVRLPPASPACCDKPAVESLHLHSVKRNLVAHHRS
jgi:hypothetical protein